MPALNTLSWTITLFEEKAALGSLVTRFVSSIEQTVDIFTKPLSRNQVELLCDKLGIRPAPSPNLRGYAEDIGEAEPNQIETKNQTEFNPTSTKSQKKPKISRSSRH